MWHDRRSLPPPSPQAACLRASVVADMERGPEGEERVAQLLLTASEAAVHGVLRYKSAQLLVRRAAAAPPPDAAAAGRRKLLLLAAGMQHAPPRLPPAPALPAGGRAHAAGGHVGQPALRGPAEASV